jgi:hypothetical protein
LAEGIVSGLGATKTLPLGPVGRTTADVISINGSLDASGGLAIESIDSRKAICSETIATAIATVSHPIPLATWPMNPRRR